MCVKLFVLAAGLSAVVGCAGNVTIPSLGLDHPANPQAAAAPLPLSATIPALENDATTMGGMRNMDHGSKKGMNHDAMQDMGHGSMKSAPAMKDMEEMEQNEGSHHEH